MTIEVRTYGDAGPFVAVLHGGPGAAGYMAPVARGLAHSFRVLEPLQRESSENRLTVGRHIEDLKAVLDAFCPSERPALVGSSWGAMLALAFAAEFPGVTGPIVLVGCGTFDPIARSRMTKILEERLDQETRERIEGLVDEIPDPDERLEAMGNLLLPLYSQDAVKTELDLTRCDAVSYRESWDDMLRLQREGVYPAAFRSIESPVLMLHGAVDPHPGALIRESLEPFLQRLEYREWERCGHYPWLERAIRREFFDVLINWLREMFGAKLSRTDVERV